MARLERLRQCGRYETYSTGKHHIGFHKRIGVTATFIFSSFSSTIQRSNNSLETLIFFALRILIQKHANLSAIPINEDQSFPDVYLARLPRIDLRSCVQFFERQTPFPGDGEQDEELDRLLMRLHDLDFKDASATKPVWRLVVVSEKNKSDVFTATWFFHHVISDGGSAVLFHEEFLAALNTVCLSEDTIVDPIVEAPTDIPLPQPFESLHLMQISWPFFLHAIAKALFPSIFNRRPAKLWSGNTLPKDISSIQNPQYRTLTFPADVSRKLAQKCRAEKTSVTATLQCLLAASLFTALPASEYDMLKVNGPIAMRRFLTPEVSNDQFTNATSLYETWHYRQPTTTTDTASTSSNAENPGVLQNFTWSSAREVKSAIQADVAKAGAYNPIALLKYVDNIHAFLSSSLGKPRTPSVQLTNLGVYKPKSVETNRTAEGKKADGQQGNWSIGRMVYSTDAFSGAALGVSVISGGDGNLVVCFCWMEGAFEEGLLESVVEGVREGVGGLVAA